ncbi:unnamed protein product [Cyprideis torosa]|uniref:Uncharacterized protein n=1 Tax=Cyprideis torosa TaxID=163714 RepID=A0A7R8WDF2_9CRUS|nr:unnamed protein product [Cyprideis torosa]CAG0888323.1 unnamed protein product [Cyprideis torosa]
MGFETQLLTLKAQGEGEGEKGVTTIGDKKTEGGGLQWIEESFTDFPKGINWRSYVVCDVAYSDVNNWLWTPFVEKRTANRLYIEVKFSMRDCSLFPGTALSCKETFSLLYYEFDVATKEPPPWQLESYKLVDRIAADEGRFTQSNSVIFNTEIRSIPVTKKGVYFAFRDQGACISLLAIKIYYISCPRTTVGLATFEETPAGPELTSIVKVKGECVRHAVLTDRDSSPTFLCKADGTWKYLSGGCVCQAGYEADDKNQTCKAQIQFAGNGRSFLVGQPIRFSSSGDDVISMRNE